MKGKCKAKRGCQPLKKYKIYVVCTWMFHYNIKTINGYVTSNLVIWLLLENKDLPHKINFVQQYKESNKLTKYI